MNKDESDVVHAVRCREISGDADLRNVAELAANIWREHYVPIIGSQQVEYMLERFQSVQAMRRQIDREYYRYFVAEHGDAPVAYAAVQRQGGKDAPVFLSKLYVEKRRRGKGYAKTLLRFALRQVDVSAETVVSLTVNKGNTASVLVYGKLGFAIVGERNTDIGGGFFMDDYHMEAPAEILLRDVR